MPTSPPLTPCSRRPKKQRGVAVGKGDDGNAEDKDRAAEDHQRLAAQPVGEQTGKQGGEDAAQQHGGDDDGELAGVSPEVASR